MTKKDFELIASVIRFELVDFLKENPFLATEERISFLNTLVTDFSETLASKNPRFNKDKFLLACGVEVLKVCKKCDCIIDKNNDCLCGDYGFN